MINLRSASSKGVIQVISIKLLIRYTLLVMISGISTLSVSTFIIIYASITGDFGDVNILDAAISIDAVINAYCICLLFGFSTDLYYKLCSAADKCLKSIFISKIMKHTNNDNNDDLKTKEQFEQLIFENE